jgi:hypothetical protein
LAGIIQREGMLTLLLQGGGHGIGLINKVRKGKVVTLFRETDFLEAEKLEESSRRHEFFRLMNVGIIAKHLKLVAFVLVVILGDSNHRRQQYRGRRILLRRHTGRRYRWHDE